MSEAASEKKELKNSGFEMIHNEFLQHGWKLAHNEIDLVIYNKKADPYDEFIFKVNHDNIEVSIPLSNSPYLYKTSISGYYEACSFVYMHLEAYEHYHSDVI